MCKNPLKRTVASQFLNGLAQFLTLYQHFCKKKKKKKSDAAPKSEEGGDEKQLCFFMRPYHSLLLLLHIIVCFSVFITLCLDLVVEKKQTNKQTNKKHQIPSASLTVLQFVEGINMKKQI